MIFRHHVVRFSIFIKFNSFLDLKYTSVGRNVDVVNVEEQFRLPPQKTTLKLMQLKHFFIFKHCADYRLGQYLLLLKCFMGSQVVIGACLTSFSKMYLQCFESCSEHFQSIGTLLPSTCPTTYVPMYQPTYPPDD